MPVTHRAAGGGLLDHVRALATNASRFGNDVTVVARASTFLTELRDAGLSTIVCDFDDPESLAEFERRPFEWDLIHAHPFSSRAFGVRLARLHGRPLVVTIHGWYDDHIERWYDDASAVIAISPAISDLLRARVSGPGEKIITIPNGIKVAVDRSDDTLTLSPPFQLSVASRLDADFIRVKGLISEFIRAAQEHDDVRWHIAIAGDGTHRREFESELSALTTEHRGPSVSFMGWMDSDRLGELYQRSFAVVAPGRSAVDAMASGVPTVMTRQFAVHSMLGAESPLGQFHGASTPFLHGRHLYDQVRALAEDPLRWRELSDRLKRATRLLYDDEHWQQVTNAVYEYASIATLLSGGRRA